MSTAIESRSAFERFIDVIIDRIVLFTDYYIVRKHITLSETALFALCVVWFLWLVFAPSLYAMPATVLSVHTWTWIFGILSLAHFVGFFFKDILYRALIVCTYAFIWCCLMLLTLYLESAAPPAPTMIVLMMMSVFIAVRLFRERRQGP